MFVPAPIVNTSQQPITVGSQPWSVEIHAMEPEQPNQNISQFRRERLSITPQLAKATGLKVGQQVIVRIPGHDFKAMTIGHFRREVDPLIVRMNADAYGQFELAVGVVQATLETGAIASDVTLVEAEAQGLIREEVFHHPDGNDVLCFANHGGLIEPWTYEQSIIAHNKFLELGRRSSYYAAQGFPPASGSPTRITSTFWHITAADFRADRGCWPAWATLWNERFSWAISFHGRGPGEIVGVGGLADEATLLGAVAAIQAVLPESYTVSLEDAEHLDGTSDRNGMNRLAAPHYRTIQIEQGWEARRDHHVAIAEALAVYVSGLIGP